MSDIEKLATMNALKSYLVTAKTNLPQSPEFSEESFALQFAEQHKNDLRYVAKWKRWLHWDEKCWNFDDIGMVENFARNISRSFATEAMLLMPRAARSIASAKTPNAVLQLSRSDPRLAATVDQWDANSWLLNTPGGVVDLLTGQVRPHSHYDYCTKIAGVSPDWRKPTPAWDRFLSRVMGGDTELVSFLQRVCGYGLTGITREHALFFCYGTGTNGKSTFLNAISGCVGDYHHVASMQTFTATKSDSHPTDLAGLVGARLVTAVETEEGKGWAEAKIKQLTGGDKISARFMRQDFFDFTPVFKLIIAGNHKPSLQSVDEAIRRRFHLIPFLVTIPKDERDDTLAEKLKTEWPGILAWMIDGCLAWQRKGLNPPPAVLSATTAYFDAEDVMGAWLVEACFREPDAWGKSTELFRSYKAWAERAGEPPLSSKQFSQKLEARGFRKQHRNTGNVFLGLRVIPQMGGSGP